MRRRDVRAYARTRRALAVTGAVRSLLDTVAFAYGPTGAFLDRCVGGVPRWLQPAMFGGLASIGGAMVDAPVAFVEGYAIERRYGLSEQTARAWAIDYAKGAALGAGVTALLATLMGAVVRRAPRRWPLITAAGAFPLLVLANLVVPLYVLPLFNRFEALDGPLEVRLRALAARFGVGDADILRMDMSRQTKKANAFVTGIAQTHRIVLGDTLIEHFTPDEIAFIVAHELGHYLAKDTWRTIGVSLAMIALLALVAEACTRDEGHDRAIGLARIYAVMACGSSVMQPFILAFSRSREWAADRFALATTHDAAAGAAAFRRLRDQNLAEEDPPRWYEVLFSTHPNLKSRITALEQS